MRRGKEEEQEQQQARTDESIETSFDFSKDSKVDRRTDGTDSFFWVTRKLPHSSWASLEELLSLSKRLTSFFMASNGWFRVAMGLRKVAQAVAVEATKEGNQVLAKAAQHTVELGSSARMAVLAAQHQAQSSWQSQDGHYSGSNRTSNSTLNSWQPQETSTTLQASLEACNKQSVQELSKESKLDFDMADNSVHLTSDIGTPDSSMAIDPVNEATGPPREPSHTSPDEEVNDSPYERLKEGKRVPSSRFDRALGFASLGMGLALGTAVEATSRILGRQGSSGSIITNDANADRLAATLCRMRGAALKMGQMLSIQDESLLPPALTRALNQVRQGADAMPHRQLFSQLESQLGKDWREQFIAFDELPFAAASIGQVHRAKILRDDKVKDVIVKVQYPGVANSIESDLRNLTMLVKMTGFAPKGLFIDNVIRVGREELKVECDYLREKENQKRFKNLVENDPILQRERFVVPDVIDELTTSEILTAEYYKGGTIDKVMGLDQEERNRIGRYIFYLTIQELFVWRFMQTDPNWGNFLYDMGSRKTVLIDFGAAREYPKSFVDGYLRIVWANANRDEETLMDLSHKMGFLTGAENDIMLRAHVQSGFTLGEPFATNEPFDFRGSEISSRLSSHSSAFMQHRLT
jgi:aarF domain-containing kinase